MPTILEQRIQDLRRGGFKVNIEYLRKIEGDEMGKAFRRFEIKEINDFLAEKEMAPVKRARKGGKTIVTIVDLRTFRQSQAVAHCHDKDTFKRAEGAAKALAVAAKDIKDKKKIVSLQPIYLNKEELENYAKFKAMTPEEKDAYKKQKQLEDLAVR